MSTEKSKQVVEKSRFVGEAEAAKCLQDPFSRPTPTLRQLYFRIYSESNDLNLKPPI